MTTVEPPVRLVVCDRCGAQRQVRSVLVAAWTRLHVLDCRDLVRLRQELDEARMCQQMAEDRAALADGHVGEYQRVLAERDRMRDNLEQVLQQHYLAYIACDHERKLDNPQCACSLVNLGWHPTVGVAARAWVDHVLDVLRSGTPDAEPAPGGEQ